MFENAELGNKLSRRDYEDREPALHAGLLDAQRSLRGSDCQVIILVSGVEGAGKGEVVRRLHQWLDVRGLQTHAFWHETDEERERPRYWRFWRALPPRGTIGILFGSWYTDPIIRAVTKQRQGAKFDRELERIRHFEDTLVDDGALLIKLWFHLSKDCHRERIEADAANSKRSGKGSGKRRVKVSPTAKKFARLYDQFLGVSERALRRTDVAHAPWHIIEADNRRYRDICTGEIVLNQITQRLAAKPARRVSTPGTSTSLSAKAPTHVLDRVPLDREIDDKTYRKKLDKYQSKLYDLTWQARARGISTVAVFEGWDAAGKGGAIRRLTQSMDARLYRVISVAAPTDEEKAQHYLWRFWRQLPLAGYHTIYDRSWYGRVLVERVEKFAHGEEWRRAYAEINAFEEQLTHHGVVMIKFWLHIDQAEQLRRFEEREKLAHKRHKITDEDWRNRERWDDYEAAVDDMVRHTSTEIAPWRLIAGNDKRIARLEVLQHYYERLAARLKQRA